MEILIAILWYLQVFTLNTTYTFTEFDQAMIQHQPEIITVQSDPQLVGTIINDYDGSINVLEEMPDEEAGPDGWYRKELFPD